MDDSSLQAQLPASFPKQAGDLSPRLQTVADLIPSCETVVDVGSDHGKLSLWCLKNNVCKDVIATDIHELPAKRTEALLSEEQWSDRSRVLVTDGLSGVDLKKEMTVVIAGMGGLEICKILDAAGKTAQGLPKGIRMVLQPQRSFYEVRSFLCENGFAILDERIAKEKRYFYTVILAEYTGETYDLSEVERFLGPVILSKKPAHFGEFMKHQKGVMAKRALGDPRCKEILDTWEKWL